MIDRRNPASLRLARYLKASRNKSMMTISHELLFGDVLHTPPDPITQAQRDLTLDWAVERLVAASGAPVGQVRDALAVAIPSHMRAVLDGDGKGNFNYGFYSAVDRAAGILGCDPAQLQLGPRQTRP